LNYKFRYGLFDQIVADLFFQNATHSFKNRRLK